MLIINKGHIVAEDTPENLQMRLQGGTRILVTVQGKPQESLLERLRALQGVQMVAGKDDGQIEIVAEEGSEVRPLIARTVLESGHNLLEMRRAAMSLEEIFLQLIGEETAAEAPAEGEPETAASAEATEAEPTEEA